MSTNVVDIEYEVVDDEIENLIKTKHSCFLHYLDKMNAQVKIRKKLVVK